jgi:hypothetical protein
MKGATHRLSPSFQTASKNQSDQVEKVAYP